MGSLRRRSAEIGGGKANGTRIVATPDEGFWLTGYFAGPFPFGATELTPAGVNNNIREWLNANCGSAFVP